MGFFGNIGGRVRNLLRFDKEQVRLSLSKGGTSSGFPQTGFDLLQAYGYDILSDYLKLEHDLMARYVDYEEMDDYPELACISGDLQLPCLVLPRNMVSSNEEAKMGVSKMSNRRVGEMAKDWADGKIDRLFVFAFDHKEGKVKVAEAKGPIKTGRKKVYRVTYESYRKKDAWSIETTGDHLFMRRDGSYSRADQLRPGDRLMPCTVRTGPTGYAEVYEPLCQTAKGNPTYKYVHQLVAGAVIGRDFENTEVVHHINRDRTDYRPSNLKVTTLRQHVADHWEYPGTHEEHVRKISEGTAKKWADPHFKLRVSRSQQSAKPEWLDNEKAGKHKCYQATGRLSDEHRAAIAKGRTIPLAKDVVEAALRASSSLNDASKKLEVSWNTLVRRIECFGIDRGILGSNLGGPQPGGTDYKNHRVVSVEEVGTRDVYDIEVPGYHNFAVGDEDGNGKIFIHNSAIDIYADDATQVESLQNRVVWVKSPDKTVEMILEDLFYRRLRIDEEIWSMARTLVKYGNDYEELLVTGDGVVGINFLPPPTMRRIEGRKGELFGFIQDYKGRFGYSPQEFKQLLTQRMANATGNQAYDKYAALEDWEVMHMRLRSRHRRSIYGYSILEPARWIWKRLMLLEDAAIVYRLQRAPQRYAFYVDVGDLPPKEAFAFLHKVRQQYKKTKFYNPQTGKLDLKFNPLSQDEDFFVPVRKGQQATKIDVVGSPAWQHMEDVEYFRLKLYSAIKVPKVYLGSEAPRAKGVLSQEDVRFARTVLRLQRELRNGLKKMARVHLAALGIQPNAVDYEIYMTIPSSIFELAQLEVRNAKADFAGRMSQFVSLHWILQKIFGLSDTEIEYIIKERHEEAMADAEVQAKGMGLQMDVQNKAQAQALQQQTQIQGQAALQQAGAAQPNTKESEDTRSRLRELGSLSHMWPQMRQRLGYRPITEQELFAGNREHEKRVEDDLEKILSDNSVMSSRLSELRHLLNELRLSSPGNGYGS